MKKVTNFYIMVHCYFNIFMSEEYVLTILSLQYKRLNLDY